MSLIDYAEENFRANWFLGRDKTKHVKLAIKGACNDFAVGSGSAGFG